MLHKNRIVLGLHVSTVCNSIQECLHVQLKFNVTTVVCNVVALAFTITECCLQI